MWDHFTTFATHYAAGMIGAVIGWLTCALMTVGKRGDAA
jgi:hypothetical protein